MATGTTFYDLLVHHKDDIQEFLDTKARFKVTRPTITNTDVIGTVDSAKSLESILDLDLDPCTFELGACQTMFYRLKFCAIFHPYGFVSEHELPSVEDGGELVTGWNSIVRTDHDTAMARRNGETGVTVTGPNQPKPNSNVVQPKDAGISLDSLHRTLPGADDYRTTANDNGRTASLPSSAIPPRNGGNPTTPTTPTSWWTSSPGRSRSSKSSTSGESMAATMSPNTTYSGDSTSSHRSIDGAHGQTDNDDARQMMFIVLGYVERLDLRCIDGPGPGPDDLEYYIDEDDGTPSQGEVDEILCRTGVCTRSRNGTLTPVKTVSKDVINRLKALRPNKPNKNGKSPTSWIDSAAWTETELWVVLKIDGNGKRRGIYLVPDEETLGKGGASLLPGSDTSGQDNFLWAKLGDDFRSCIRDGFGRELKLSRIATGTARHGFVYKDAGDSGVVFKPVY